MLNILRKIKLNIRALEGILLSFVNNKFNHDFKCTQDTLRCCDNKKSPSFRYHVVGRNIPVCCATHLVNILQDVVSVLDKHHIQYFISFGTLLGSVRHGGIIPWDTDIDIIISKDDQERIYQILQQDLKKQYLTRIDQNENLVGGEVVRVFFSEKNYLHVDLFPYVKSGDTLSFYEQKTFKLEDIFPLSKVSFYDFTVSAPKEVEGHLLSLYGEGFMKSAYKQWAANKSKFKITDFSAAQVEK